MTTLCTNCLGVADNLDNWTRLSLYTPSRAQLANGWVCPRCVAAVPLLANMLHVNPEAPEASRVEPIADVVAAELARVDAVADAIANELALDTIPPPAEYQPPDYSPVPIEAFKVIPDDAPPFRGARSFGRFIYVGELWGSTHVWSTTDPPNYGATICLDGDGTLNEDPREGEHDAAPTVDEIQQAQAMVWALAVPRVPPREPSPRAFSPALVDATEPTDDRSIERQHADEAMAIAKERIPPL